MTDTSRLRAFLELARPANVITAFADILAGFAAAGAFGALLRGMPAASWQDLVLLLVSTAGLYGGGVVLNDVFDAELDAIERPERPIPSGRISLRHAAIFGSLLLLIGVAAAAVVGLFAGLIALMVAGGAVLYDAAGKHHPLLGPVNMGLCRGGNLLLGVSAVPTMLGEVWFVLFIPVVYIGAVTAVSRGEVYGGQRPTGTAAVLLVGVVIGALLLLGIRLDYRMLHALPFIAVFALLVLPPFVRGALDPTPVRLRKAVKLGVISLVAMDAALAAGFGGWSAGLIVLILLPVSLLVGRIFAVT